MKQEEWDEIEHNFVGMAKAMRELKSEIPKCKKCSCNWPKVNIDADGLCPNCRPKP